jgi:hypothetical protein
MFCAFLQMGNLGPIGAQLRVQGRHGKCIVAADTPAVGGDDPPRLRQHLRANSYLPTVVTTMFMMGDYDPAEALCRDAIDRGDAGGFSIGRQSGPSQSFPNSPLLG